MLPSISLPSSSFPGFCPNEKVFNSTPTLAVNSKHCLLFVGLRTVISIAVSIALILCSRCLAVSPGCVSVICSPSSKVALWEETWKLLLFPLSPAITSMFCSRKVPQNFWCANCWMWKMLVWFSVGKLCTLNIKIRIKVIGIVWNTNKVLW